MSDFPELMMKHSLSAPPAIKRSTRNSPTARGRSAPPSTRLPTGNSSFENPKGWSRVPRPAAGMIPHMADSSHRLQDGFKLLRTRVRGVTRQHALLSTAPDGCKIVSAHVQHVQ